MARINPDNIAKQQYKTAAPVGASDVRYGADVNAGRNEIGEALGGLSASLQKTLGQQYETQKVEEINAGREWALKNQKESKKNLKDKDVATVNALSVWGMVGAEEIKGKRHAQEFKTQFELGLREAFDKKEGVALDPAGMNDYLADSLNKYIEENGIESQIAIDSFRKETTAFIDQKNKNHLIKSSALLEEMTIENIGDTIGASLNDLDFTKDGLKDMSDSALESWAKDNNVSGDIDEIKQAWKDKQEQNTIDQIQLFLDDQINKHPRIDINEITAKVLIQYGLSGDPEFMQKAISQLRSGTGPFNTPKVQALLNANRGPLNDQRRKNQIDNDRTVSDLTIQINQYNGEDASLSDIIQSINDNTVLSGPQKSKLIAEVRTKNLNTRRKISQNEWGRDLVSLNIDIANGKDLKDLTLTLTELKSSHQLPPEVDVDSVLIQSIGQAFLNRKDFNKEDLAETLKSLPFESSKVDAYLFSTTKEQDDRVFKLEGIKLTENSREEAKRFKDGYEADPKKYDEFISLISSGAFTGRLGDFEEALNKFDFLPSKTKSNLWQEVMTDTMVFNLKAAEDENKNTAIKYELINRIAKPGHMPTEVEDVTNSDFNKRAVSIIRSNELSPLPENWDTYDDAAKESYYIEQFVNSGVSDPEHTNLMNGAYAMGRKNGPNGNPDDIKRAYTTFRQYTLHYTDGGTADDLNISQEVFDFYEAIQLTESSNQGDLDGAITRVIQNKFIDGYVPTLVKKTDDKIQEITNSILEDPGYGYFTMKDLNPTERDVVSHIITNKANELISNGRAVNAADAEDALRNHIASNFLNHKGNLIAKHPTNQLFQSGHMIKTFDNLIANLENYQRSITQEQVPYGAMVKDLNKHSYELIGDQYILTNEFGNPVPFDDKKLLDDIESKQNEIAEINDKEKIAELTQDINDLILIRSFYIISPGDLEELYHKYQGGLDAYPDYYIRKNVNLGQGQSYAK